MEFTEKDKQILLKKQEEWENAHNMKERRKQYKKRKRHTAFRQYVIDNHLDLIIIVLTLITLFFQIFRD